MQTFRLVRDIQRLVRDRQTVHRLVRDRAEINQTGQKLVKLFTDWPKDWSELEKTGH